MEQSSQENTAITAPPVENGLDERLARIEAGVAELRQAALKDARKEIEDKKKGSRSAVTIAFALAGAKIGSLVAAKGIFVGEAAAQFRRQKGELYKEFKKETEKASDRETMMNGFQKLFALLETDFLKEIGMKTLIWGGVGAAIGGIIGWARGDRINDVHDLIKHPVDSLKKIIGLKPKDPEPEVALVMPKATVPAKPAAPLTAAANPVPESSATDWQKKHAKPEPSAKTEQVVQIV